MPRSTGHTREPDRIVARSFDVASAYDLKLARDQLFPGSSAKLLDSNPLTIQFAPRRIVAVFEYGSIVFFNFDENECQVIIDRIKACASRPYKTVSRDDFALYLAPREKKPEGTDELYIKDFNRDTAILVAVVLSRSVALEYYEALVGNSLARLEQTVTGLAGTGRIPRGERELTRQVGLGLLIEHELAYSVSAFDDPDIIWEGGARMNQLYLALKREFDLDDRIKVIQQKVSLVSRWSTFVIARIEGHRSRMLEWIIIILIFSEIILFLLRVM